MNTVCVADDTDRNTLHCRWYLQEHIIPPLFKQLQKLVYLSKLTWLQHFSSNFRTILFNFTDLTFHSFLHSRIHNIQSLSWASTHSHNIPLTKLNMLVSPSVLYEVVPLFLVLTFIMLSHHIRFHVFSLHKYGSSVNIRCWHLAPVNLKLHNKPQQNYIINLSTIHHKGLLQFFKIYKL